MNEDDLRVKRTRRLLKAALVELVHEYGYAPLTIRQIAERAHVGYKTFFRHYAGKEALLQAVANDIVATLRQQIVPPTAPDAPRRNTVKALQIAHQHAPVVLAVYHSPAAERLLAPLRQISREEGRWFAAGSGLPESLIAHHFATSMVELVIWWLEDGQDTSVAQMADYIDRLLLTPLTALRQQVWQP